MDGCISLWMILAHNSRNDDDLKTPFTSRLDSDSRRMMFLDSVHDRLQSRTKSEAICECRKDRAQVQQGRDAVPRAELLVEGAHFLRMRTLCEVIFSVTLDCTSCQYVRERQKKKKKSLSLIDGRAYLVHDAHA